MLNLCIEMTEISSKRNLMSTWKSFLITTRFGDMLKDLILISRTLLCGEEFGFRWLQRDWCLNTLQETGGCKAASFVAMDYPLGKVDLQARAHAAELMAGYVYSCKIFSISSH
jgi:hypothetical protein